MIGIRADANNVIATGHVMRCITIANALRKLGEDVIFITSDHGADALLAGESFEHIVLDIDWNTPDAESDRQREIVRKYDIRVMLIDSYLVNCEYIEEISKECKVAYIDDLHEHIYPVDLLINYNGYCDNWNYVADYKNVFGHDKINTTKLLLGPMYAPLREQFLEHNPRGGNGRQILLAAGGGDICRLMYGVLKNIANLQDELLDTCDWHVVIGRYIENEGELLELAESMPNVTVHKNVSNMAELMSECDIAISAAGTMLTECAVMRLATIYAVTADNQRYDANYWCRNGAMIYAGDVTADRDKTLGVIVSELRSLVFDEKRREDCAKKLATITDGKGAQRIAQALASL